MFEKAVSFVLQYVDMLGNKCTKSKNEQLKE